MSDELAQLMQEPAGGDNHGRRASTNPEVEGRHLPLDADEWQASEFMRGNGWNVVETSRGSGGSTFGARDAGMSAHRGVVHSDEYVDTEALRPMVEFELGFTYEQVRSVYRQGLLSAEQRELRGCIDARLLSLSRAGTNLALLGRLLGFPVKDNGNCRVMENALTRARAKEDN